MKKTIILIGVVLVVALVLVWHQWTAIIDAKLHTGMCGGTWAVLLPIPIPGADMVVAPGRIIGSGQFHRYRFEESPEGTHTMHTPEGEHIIVGVRSCHPAPGVPPRH